jgi:hypothetical protein
MLSKVSFNKDICKIRLFNDQLIKILGPT